jgi:hypothetical protein
MKYIYVIYEPDYIDGYVNLRYTVEERWFDRFIEKQLEHLSIQFDNKLQERSKLIVEITQPKTKIHNHKNLGYVCKYTYRYGADNKKISEDMLYVGVNYEKVILYDPINIIQ